MLIPTFEDVIGGVHVKYRSCPNTFIPASVHAFLRIYDYYKAFPGAHMPGMGSVSGRFLKAFNVFEAARGEFTPLAMEQQREKVNRGRRNTNHGTTSTGRSIKGPR